VSAVGLLQPEVRFPLRPGRGEVALHAGGFRHPASRWTGAERFTAYGDVTHLQLGHRQLRIGTRQGVWILPRGWFAEPDGAERLVHALFERIAEEPGARAQLAAMAEAEQLLREPRGLRATPLAAALCVAVFALEQWLGPVVHHAGFMSPLLAGGGEPWRLLTANVLHADVTHLTLNVLDTLGLISTSFGRWWSEPGGQSAELVDEREFRYLSLQFGDDVLVGATALGLTEHVGVLRGLIGGRVRLGPWKDRLLANPLQVAEAYLARGAQAA